MLRLNMIFHTFKSQGYDVIYFETKEEAVDYIDSCIDGTIVGIGGSQTVEQIGLFEKLSTHNTVYWHDRKPENMAISETRLAASRAPIYISSENAISEDGVIVNIDNTGNRVAAISYGPEEVYFVLGVNKFTEDYESALYRARNVAAPLNAKRLNRNTPCAINADRCYDCKSSDRICRNLSVLWDKPTGANYHIVIINEDLGY
mgnify:CR=1 FL=1